MLLPTAYTASRLFATGATIGPIIDGLHNQALLRYDLLPICFQFTETVSLKTSAVVPPLLGITYIVLGSILPNALDELLKQFPFRTSTTTTSTTMEMSTLVHWSEPQNGNGDHNNKYHRQQQHQQQQQDRHFFWLTIRAMAAVVTTAAIVRWTEVLITASTMDLPATRDGVLMLMNPSAFSSAGTMESYLLLLITVCIVQWAWLDGTMTTLLVASLAAVVGPLAELPFLSWGWWEYFNSPALFYPLGEASSIGIHSLTGPCYFAVTMDAIALGRWFSAMELRRNEHVTTSQGEENENSLQAINGAIYNPEDLVVKEQPVMLAVGEESDTTTEHAKKR